MAKDMTLLWCSGSVCCWRLMIALEEKNLQGYNQKKFSFEKMGHKSKEVMDMNPRGQVPAFKHGDRVLNESYAACMYLENQFKSQGNQLIPDCPDQQALMYQRMFEGLTLFQKMMDLAIRRWGIPEGERVDSEVQKHREALTAEVQLWEGYLQKTSGGFLAGKTFSMADVVVFPTIGFGFCSGLSEERYPKLAAYNKSLKDRPSIKATWALTFKECPDLEDVLNDV